MSTVTLIKDFCDVTKEERYAYRLTIGKKTAYLVTATENGVIVSKENNPWRGWKSFDSIEAAISHYKSPNIKKALAFLPEYITAGYVGTVEV